MQLNTISDWIRTVIPSFERPNLKTSSELQELSITSGYQSSMGSISGEADIQIALNQKQLALELTQAPPKVLEKISELNQKRTGKGLEPISMPKVTRQLEAIYRDSSLSEKQKKEKIEQLRKQLGLSKGDMKKLFTKRIEAAYKSAEKRLADFERAKSEQLNSELKQAEANYGKDSAQAKSVSDKLATFKSSLDLEKQNLKAQAKFFGSIYPSFFSKLGAAFKKFGQIFSKVLGILAQALRFIPALGPVVSGAMRSIQSLLQGKFKDFGKALLSTAMGAAKNLAHLIPGVGAIASFAVTGIEAVLKATRSVRTP